MTWAPKHASNWKLLAAIVAIVFLAASLMPDWIERACGTPPTNTTLLRRQAVGPTKRPRAYVRGGRLRSGAKRRAHGLGGRFGRVIA